MREVQRGTFVEGFAASAQSPLEGQHEFQDDLLVTGPVARVGEDEDGFDLVLGKIACA